MRFIVRQDPLTASHYVAHHIIERIKRFAPTAGKPFVLGLPTGSSPELIYHILVEEFKAGNVSFENVVTFNMDEYIGLPRSHPESYHSFMFSKLFSHIDIRPQNVHLLDGNAADLDSECAAYEAKIAAHGGIELFLGGAGPDGHIAFNEPGSSLQSRTRVQYLTPTTVRANSRFFGGSLDMVPKSALTVGVGTIMEAREVVVIITGAHKSLALQKAVEGPLSHMCTLSCLQQHPNAMIAVDEDATLELQVKTLKYFTGVERTQQEDAKRRNALALQTRFEMPMTPPSVQYDDDEFGELNPECMSARIVSNPLF